MASVEVVHNVKTMVSRPLRDLMVCISSSMICATCGTVTYSLPDQHLQLFCREVCRRSRATKAMNVVVRHIVYRIHPAKLKRRPHSRGSPNNTQRHSLPREPRHFKFHFNKEKNVKLIRKHSKVCVKSRIHSERSVGLTLAEIMSGPAHRSLAWHHFR
jgi:hypothetical protein